MTNPNVFASSPKHIYQAAPASGNSSVRSLSTTLPQMHPSHTPPIARPRSPLSPRYEPTPRFEPMRSPSPRNMTTRNGISQRRGSTNALKLPSLPRFHPSNFPSSHTSLQPTPDSGQVSPQPPASPRSHQRVISDAQKRLFAYQREMISAAQRSSTSVHLINPESPRLAPLGSPGPVTPLELEAEDGGYLVAGTRGTVNEGMPSEDLITKLAKEEAVKQRRSGSRQSTR